LVKQGSNTTVAVICKTRHQDLSDGVFLFHSNLSKMGLAGTMPLQKAYDIARNVSVSFLAGITAQYEKLSGFYPTPNEKPHSEVKFNNHAIQHLLDHVNE
jgi:hypothetical protein